ncbi:MAG: hypothetical protein QOJ97_1237 [Solirubrobacteraceae bacterium]|nr:hypothetical protein [Solirubrobacteraceae bacterium]
MVRESPGSEPSHVVVLRTLGATERRRRRPRKPRAADPEPAPESVPTTSATVVDAAGVDEARARDWLAEPAADGLDESLAVVNRVLQAQRVATADPYAPQVGLSGALVVRRGYGRGEQVAEGRWEEAVEVPVDRGGSGRRQRRDALRPQERLAALLSARDAALACEELTLRARADLDAGRAREAALQVRVALEAGLAELERDTGRVEDMHERLDGLRERRKAIGEAANQALAGPTSPEADTAVAEAVAQLEAALRARSAAGFEPSS